MQQWRIFQVLDKNRELKEVPQKQLDRLYTIVRVEIGLPALFESNDGGALITSFMEDVKMENKTVTFESKWKIIDSKDKQGNPKEIPEKRKNRIYTIGSLFIGLPAVMMAEDGAMVSSFVQDYNFVDDLFLLTTENTVYTFELCEEDEGVCD